MTERVRRGALAIVALVAGVWLVTTCLWTVRQDEEGVVTRFGRVVRVVSPGIQLTLPWPIETLRRVNIGELRKMTVGYRLDDVDPSVTRNESEWLSGDTNIVEIRLAAQYRVADPVRYATRYEPNEAEFLLRKLVESSVTRRVSAMGVDDLITIGKSSLGRVVLSDVREKLERFETGVLVESINFEKLAPSDTVNMEFRAVTNAQQEAETMLSTADGTKRRVLQQAEADSAYLLEQARSYRETVVGAASGAASRFRELLTQYRRAPEVFRERMVRDAFSRIFVGSSKPKLAPVDSEGPVKIRIYR